jgi:16S rRNA (uracil1498-N3)-methyltransferase
MHIFYTPDISSDEYVLNEEESRHCMKVLRLPIGTHIHLVDGRGGLYIAEIISADKRYVRLSIIQTTREYQKRNHHLHIAIAPTKNIDRLEWFLEKATEIGIDEVTPLITERSERKVVKEDRLFKVITSAVKQSLQAYHPVLNPLTTFNEFIKRENEASKMIAHCLSEAYRAPIQRSENNSYLILIGPEGDFTPVEVDNALQNDFKAVTLGNTRLRTETAALAACFEVNYLNR